MKASHCKYILDFKRPSGTSRGILTTKETHFIVIEDGKKRGIGECGLLRGLSIDDVAGYEAKLSEICSKIDEGLESLLEQTHEFPSIQFGLEQAFVSLAAQDPFVLFPSAFTKEEVPIPINGLIWMGEESFLYEQLEQKVKDGFRCIKMKVGALDFNREVDFLRSIRTKYTPSEVELRLDANGAFHPDEALQKLNTLSEFAVHSIEQPIAKGQELAMAELCLKSPIPIALDEELIGMAGVTEKIKLLQTTMPQYIILKPSLLGGLGHCHEWIDLAQDLGIGWWITSALESNIGLNAIAQWTYSLRTDMVHGLGTGSLYVNNIDSPLRVQSGNLYYKRSGEWPPGLIQEICS